VISTGVVTAARVTHDSGSVDQLAAASPENQEAAAVTELLTVPNIEEAYVLSTCNRVEAYVVGSDHTVGRAALAEFFAAIDNEAVVTTDHDESLRHLLRVAAGLESVILGEDQIIGQVRTAYEDARDAGGIGSMLEAAVTKAIHVGERARTETAINEGVVVAGLGRDATGRPGDSARGSDRAGRRSRRDGTTRRSQSRDRQRRRTHRRQPDRRPRRPPRRRYRG